MERGPNPPPPSSTSTVPLISWAGPPSSIEAHITHYNSASIAGQRYTIGEYIYLQPADPDTPLYIACIKDFIQDNASQGPPSMSVQVEWFYRPEELDLDAPLPVFGNEIFASDEKATHPLDSIAGKCRVIPPSAAVTSIPRKQERASVNTHHPSPPPPPPPPLPPLPTITPVLDTYICSRKYIPTEARVVALPGQEDSVFSYPRPLVLLSNNRMVSKCSIIPNTQQGIANGNAATEGQRIVQPQKFTHQQPSPSKKPAPTPRLSPRKRSAAAMAGLNPAVDATTPYTPASQYRSGSAASSLRDKPTPSDSKSGGDRNTTTTATPRSGRTNHSHGGGGGGGSGRSKKEHLGRWSQDRYVAAQHALINILRTMGATSPDTAVLRPNLREQARKVIGDTGLLDHLLKHLADAVVSPDGDRLRRRHNIQGSMVYWLQSSAQQAQEDAMMEEELTALSTEIREVREARHALQAVRHEAAQAIQAVSDLKEHPSDVAANLVGIKTPTELSHRVSESERTITEILIRVHDAESLAASRIEETYQEMISAGRIVGENVTKLHHLVEFMNVRLSDLEKKVGMEVESSQGRFEGVTSALGQAVTTINQMRSELVQRDVIIGYMQREMASLRQTVANMSSSGNTNVTAGSTKNKVLGLLLGDCSRLSPPLTTTTMTPHTNPPVPSPHHHSPLPAAQVSPPSPPS